MSIKINCSLPKDSRKFQIWNEGEIVKQSGRDDLPEVLFRGKSEADADSYMDGFMDALRIAHGMNPFISEPRLVFSFAPKG